MINKPCVYFIQSLKNNRYYIGSTTNLKERFNKHNKGCVTATKNFTPYKLVFYQEYPTITEAKRIEYRLKKLKRRDYIEKIIKNGKISLK